LAADRRQVIRQIEAHAESAKVRSDRSLVLFPEDIDVMPAARENTNRNEDYINKDSGNNLNDNSLLHVSRLFDEPFSRLFIRKIA
jgi:hypothetical protein